MSTNLNAAAQFALAAAAYPDNLALAAAGREITYGRLAEDVRRLAGHFGSPGGTGRIGILATRSVEAYTGIFAAAWCGGTYVPLNLKWPEERLVALLEALDLEALVVDANGAKLLTPAVLAAAPSRIVFPAGSGLPEGDWPGHVRMDETTAGEMAEPAFVGPDHVAYIIFTSGTTGMPKGVVISTGSLDHYLEKSRPWTGFTPNDRVGESCDVTFDLTVHNMFLTFASGASLHVLSALDMMAPQRFIRSRELTAWMSVPTLINLMRSSGALKPGIFPSLRLSVFCGEPLPLTAAQAWAAAAPNGVVENIYGPTEGTVICMRQTLADPPAVTPSRNILAIGRPYDTMEVAIFDADQNPLPDGVPGEIALSGPQLAIGYFASPEQTADRFRIILGKRWYLTGDLGCRDADGVFHHLGRTDNQVKVKGNRIELEEVEMHLRTAAGSDLVAAVAWPVEFGSAQGLVGFSAGTTRAGDEIREDMYRTLPRYMVPGQIHVLDELPVNINGKIDRKALVARLEAAAA